MFSFKRFIVPSLIFKSLIHFEFIFVYGVKKCSSFIFFMCSCPAFTAQLIEETVLPPLYILASFVKDKVPIDVGVYFLVSPLFHWSICLFL